MKISLPENTNAPSTNISKYFLKLCSKSISTNLFCLDLSCDFHFHDFLGSPASAEFMALLIVWKANTLVPLALYSNIYLSSC